MGMVDAAKNIKRTVEDIRKPRLCTPSRTSPSLPPWAWKASLFFWRRLLRRNPPKPHVIKPSATASLQVRPPCKRPKSGAITANHHAKYACGNSYFYYAYPDHEHDYVDKPHLCCDASRENVCSGLRPLSGDVTPATDEYSPNLPNMMECDSPLPYFQLHRSTQLPLPTSTSGRLPLYMVS